MPEMTWVGLVDLVSFSSCNLIVSDLRLASSIYFSASSLSRLRFLAVSSVSLRDQIERCCDRASMCSPVSDAITKHGLDKPNWSGNIVDPTPQIP